MKNMIFLICIVVLFISACGVLYTEEQVNETVVAKIREVAGMQKVNVTVQTVIVKEYVLITQTPESTATPPPPALYFTATPQPFARLTGENVFSALTAAGFGIRQYYFELDADEIGPMEDYAKSSSKFTLISDNHEIDGILYMFVSEEEREKGLQYLTSQKPGITNKAVTPIENLIIEMDSKAPTSLLTEISAVISGIR